MDKNIIYKIYGTNFKEMTKILLEESLVSFSMPNHNAFIGLKPNLVSASKASNGATTHPEIVAGVIEYLKNHGFDNICMLEGSWVGANTSEAYEICGYRKLSEKYKVPFYDLQKDTFENINCEGFSMEICSMARKLDFLINIPVLKGHCQTKVTCALKNMKGLITNREKRHFHTCGLHKPIALLNKIIHQDLVIVDNICGDLDFEDGGHPVIRNSIMAGFDPVLLDTYACRLMHTDISAVPYIKLAEELGIGSTDLTHAKIKIIKGNTAWEETELPISNKIISLQDKIDDVDSCSACYGYLLPALEKLKKENLLHMLHETICIGQGYRGKTGKLGVGNCTSLFDVYVKGCPPTENQIYAKLKDYIKNNNISLSLKDK